jgi:hypothetical protein
MTVVMTVMAVVLNLITLKTSMLTMTASTESHDSVMPLHAVGKALLLLFLVERVGKEKNE